jgi:hypothetical protein
VGCHAAHLVTVYNLLLLNCVQVRKQLGVDLQEGNIQLDAAFSTVGDFEVPILLPAGLKFKLPGDKKRLLLKVRIRRK